jgi:putative spermidine/putrescine transport system permease protein
MMHQESTDRSIGLLLTLPALIMVGCFFIVPLVWIGRISLYASRSDGVLTPALTLSSYRNFLTDPFFHDLVLRSTLFALLVTVAALFLTYPIALFLHRTTSAWRGVLVVLTISPLLISTVVRSYGWLVILDEKGWLNGLLRVVGLPTLKIANDYPAVVIGMTQIMMPYMALCLISGFGHVNSTLEDAAESLGARPLRRFWRITFPLSLPGVALGCMLTFVITISAYVTPALLGGGRVFLIATEIYTQALETLNWPLASAMSVLFLVGLVLALTLYGRASRRWGAVR